MRLSITLSDYNHAVFQQQANLLGITLSKHINNVLTNLLITEISSLDDIVNKLGGQSHFKIEGDSLDGTSPSLQANHGAGKHSSI